MKFKRSSKLTKKRGRRKVKKNMRKTKCSPLMFKKRSRINRKRSRRGGAHMNIEGGTLGIGMENDHILYEDLRKIQNNFHRNERVDIVENIVEQLPFKVYNLSNNNDAIEFILDYTNYATAYLTHSRFENYMNTYNNGRPFNNEMLLKIIYALGA